MERARDGGGTHGQHVYLGPEALEELLMPNPEPLLLVHDDEAEVLESNVRLDEAVGADHDVDASVGEARQDLSLLGLRAQPREHLNPHRERGQALREGGEVLERKDGGRHENGDLGTGVDRFEGGAHGDLSLAEADIAADEAVHGASRLHVGLHLVDGALLIGSLRVGKCLSQVAVPRAVLGVGAAPGGLPGGVELHQLKGHLPDGAAHPLLGLDPLP